MSVCPHDQGYARLLCLSFVSDGMFVYPCPIFGGGVAQPPRALGAISISLSPLINTAGTIPLITSAFFRSAWPPERDLPGYCYTGHIRLPSLDHCIVQLAHVLVIY